MNSNIVGVNDAAAKSGEAANSVLDAAKELNNQSDALRNMIETYLKEIEAASTAAPASAPEPAPKGIGTAGRSPGRPFRYWSRQQTFKWPGVQMLNRRRTGRQGTVSSPRRPRPYTFERHA